MSPAKGLQTEEAMWEQEFLVFSPPHLAEDRG